jgi:gliding motility-associated protein GldL
MAGKKKPFGLSNVISIGATVVIVGLLFKIQHWEYASTFITVGLGAEAVLFLLIGIFQREEEEIDWVRVYPELDKNFKGPLPVATSKGAGAPVQATAALDKMLADAKIGPELITSLGEGLRTFGDKVASVSKVADAGMATTEFANSIKSATAGYSQLSSAFEKATASINEMASSNIDSKAYHAQVNSLAKNISALNAVYELELQDSSAHLKSMNKFYSNLSLTMQNFNDSVADTQKFKDEVGRLAKNLASLNSVYGNMLTAMNQPRT